MGPGLGARLHLAPAGDVAPLFRYSGVFLKHAALTGGTIRDVKAAPNGLVGRTEINYNGFCRGAPEKPVRARCVWVFRCRIFFVWRLVTMLTRRTIDVKNMLVCVAHALVTPLRELFSLQELRSSPARPRTSTKAPAVENFSWLLVGSNSNKTARSSASSI